MEDPEGLGYNLVTLLTRQVDMPTDLMLEIFNASVKLVYISKGNPLMHYECYESNITLLNYLIDKGLDLKMRDRKGNTAIMHAAKLGEKKLIKHLINVGADLDLTNKNGTTVL